MENVFYSTGRRKESTARVFLSRGTGKITVNSDPLEKYFGRETNIMLVKQALKLTETLDTTDLKITVKGGGSTGQAGAIILGLGRALAKYDPSLESILRDNGYLSRDPRKVERKKPGQPGERKRFQCSKR